MSCDSPVELIEEVVFENMFLSTIGNRVSNLNSSPIAVPHHNVVISLTIENASEVSSFAFEIFGEGSFNGKYWTRSGLPTFVISIAGLPSLPHFQATVQMAVDFPYLRLRANVTSGSVRFSSQFVFSDQ